jgi:hypothetical protein
MTLRELTQRLRDGLLLLAYFDALFRALLCPRQDPLLLFG